MCDFHSDFDRSATDTIDASDGPVTRSSDASPPRSQPHVLIVDDDLGCAHFLSHALSECGHRGHIVISSSAFRQQYSRSRPDVLILDLAMPGIDGVELLRFLAEQKCDAKVILTSGVSDRVLEAAVRLGSALGLRMGPALPKPFLTQELAEALSAPAPFPTKEERQCYR